MEKLLELYTQILAAAKVTADGAGLLSVNYNGKSMPVMIKGKRLALPTSEALKSSKDKITIFHPLYENIMLNTETEVISKFRKLINTRFDYTVGMLFIKLIDLTLNTADHNKLNPDQSEVLSVLKNATDKTFEALKKLIAESDGLVSIYCKRSGKIANDPFRQASIISFPLYKELSEKREKYYGVSVSNKDRETLLKLYRFVFPNIDTPEYYNQGSNSKIAPCMEALMKAVISLGAEVNEHAVMFENIFDNVDELTINSEWLHAFENLDSLTPLIRSVPMQGSNMVEATKEESSAIKAVPTNTGMVAMALPDPVKAPEPRVDDNPNNIVIKGNIFNNNPPAHAAVVQPAPYVAPQLPMYQQQQPVNPNAPVGLSALYGNSQPQYHNQNPMYQQQQRVGFNTPQQQMQQPYYQQQQMQQPQQQQYYNGGNVNASSLV